MNTDTDADTRRAFFHSRQRQQRGTIVDIVISSVLVLMAIALFVGGLNNDNQDVAETKAFIGSPLCTSSDIDSTTCLLNVPMLVTDKYYMPGTNGSGHRLDLLARSGDKETAAFGRSSHIWEGVSPGETVEAQMWQGRVVLVTAGTLWSKTVTNPNQPHSTHVFSVVTGLLLLFALSFLVSVIRRTGRGQ